MKRFVLGLLLVGLTAGCADEGTPDKGAEEQPLTDGKDDSFFRPTEHGSLQFGIANRASFTDDEQFHSWTFALSDTAEVSLKTDVTQNLDTVMYLYHREDPSDSWGRYLKKNDDHDGNIWSQIALAGKAGEYRVVVKGFKKALRGGFAVVGSCDGAGCEASAAQCESGEFGSLPATTAYTDSCTSRILGVIGSPIAAENSGFVTASEHCSASGITRQALADYVAYWTDTPRS